MGIDLPTNYDRLSQAGRRKVREEYRKIQDGKCWYCNCRLTGDPSLEKLRMKVSPELFPPGFFIHRIHLHHDHDTGLTLGAVHAHCNAVLWEYEGV